MQRASFSALKVAVMAFIMIISGGVEKVVAQDFDTDIQHAFSKYYEGDYEQAALLFEKWLPSVKQWYGDKDTSAYAKLLTWTASCYSNLGQYGKALPYYQESAGIYLEVTGENSLRYAIAVNSMAYTYEYIGDYDKAILYYSECREIILNITGPTDLNYANVTANQGSLYRELGRFDEALKLQEEAMALYEQLLGPADPLYSNALNNLGLLEYDMGNYEQARVYLNRALEIRREVLGEHDPDYAGTLVNLGLVENALGNYRHAMADFQRAARIYSREFGPGHPLYATVLNNLAMSYEAVGDYDRSLRLHKEALEIRQKALGNTHPQTLQSMNNVAMLMQAMGDYSEAMGMYEKAAGIYRETSQDYLPEYATLLGNMAVIFKETGNYDKALSLCLEEKEIDFRILGGNHPTYATTLNNLAGLYEDLGEPSKALPLREEAKDIYLENFGPDHPMYATELANMASLYKVLGDLDRALALELEALDIRKRILGEMHPDYALTLNNLAAIYMTLNEAEKALPLYLHAAEIDRLALGENHPTYAVDLENQALLLYQTGLADQALTLIREANRIQNLYLEKNFSYLVPSERERLTGIMSHKFDVYNSILFSNNRSSVSFTGMAYDNELIHKGMILNSENAMKDAILKSGDTLLTARFISLQSARRRIIALEQSQGSPREIDSLTLRAENLEKELMRSSGDFAYLNRQFSLQWTDFKERLKPGEAAIEFTRFLYRSPAGWTDTVIYCALLIRKGDTIPHMVYLCTEADLDRTLPKPGQAGKSIDLVYAASRSIGTLQAEEGGKAENALYPLIWSPLDSLLQGIGTIYYAPAGLLHSVSMAAVACPDGALLMDRYRLVQLGSTRTLAIPQEEVEIRDAVVFGGIHYDLDTLKLLQEAEKYKPTQEGFLSMNPEPRGGTRAGFPYLEGTREEAERVSGELKREGIQVNLITGINAPEEAFLSLSGAASPTVIHIATHGFYLPDTLSSSEDRDELLRGVQGEERFRLSDDPLLRSGLIMAGGNRAWKGEPIPVGLEDGILTAKEVSNMNLLNTQLVVLSACQTGLGDVKGSEGVEGLMRGFKMAGARYVMMSLWEVPDKETVEFMQHFYSNWLGGQEIRTAFQNTQKQMRTKYPDEPYKWAAFVLVE